MNEAARARARTYARRGVSVLAFAVLWIALVAPYRPDQLTFTGFLRLPVEGLVLVALALWLPSRWSRIVAVAAGVLLAVLTVVKILDLGFYETLNRPFDPVSDWNYFGPALGVLRDSIGHRWANVVAVALVLLIVAVLACVPLAAVHLNNVARRNRAAVARAAGALGAVWLLLAALGLRIDAGQPVASTSAAGLAYDEIQLVRTSIHDRAVFEAELHGYDRQAHVPAADLLTGLRGKDVIIAFVESYGRVAVENPSIAPGVTAVLREGTDSLRSHGYLARSAFLTSPTFGGISWLAHSTFQSGLWVDSQARYDRLVDSQRFTLSDAFGRAGWRTVSDVPSNEGDWPQGRSFYHYDQLYNQDDVGYPGPSFSYAAIPDQYTLWKFNQLELAPQGREPVMGEIDLVSSHTPWAPLPQLLPWDAAGTTALYGPMEIDGATPGEVWSDTASVRAAYGESIQYSIGSLISFVEHADDPNLVLIMLGDHQPSTVVTGWGASHDVPISVIASDPAVTDRFASWGWRDGLLPSATTPVVPMDTFRNRFLTGFGSASG